MLFSIERLVGCPVAVISADSPVCTNTSVSFSGSGSYDPLGWITAFSWTWPSGTTVLSGSPPATPKVQFTSAGTKTIYLTVTDNDGETGGTSFNVTVQNANTTWSGTTSFSVTMDPAIKALVNAAINSIPGVSGVEVSEGSFTVSAKTRECCKTSGGIGNQKCGDGSLVLSANIGSVIIWGGSFDKSIDFCGWGASVHLEANVNLSGDVTANATAGSFLNGCATDCPYATASMAAGLTATAVVSASACVKLWGTDHCSPSVGAEGSAGISWSGTVGDNDCGSCSGITGSLSLNTITLTGTVTVPGYSGSYSKQIWP